MLFCIFIGVKKITDMKHSFDYQPEIDLVRTGTCVLSTVQCSVVFIDLLSFSHGLWAVDLSESSFLCIHAGQC